MRRSPSRSRVSMLIAAVALLAISGVSLVSADSPKSGRSSGSSATGANPRQPHDFTDAYYRSNGLDPARIVGRPRGQLPNSTLDPAAPDSTHNNVRKLSTSCTWDSSGHAWYFTVSGIMFPNVFTSDAAGVRARQIADSYVLYDFPRAANAQYATFPKRQEAMTDLGHGYFSNNPLGIWRIAHVKYNPATIGTSDAQRRLGDIAQRNGTDVDGTPLIKTMSELNDLRSRNLVTVTLIPSDGSAGPPWFLCPIIEDPRNGAIAPDAFIDRTLRPNGQPNPGELIFTTGFNSLRKTGDFPH